MGVGRFWARTTQFGAGRDQRIRDLGKQRCRPVITGEERGGHHQGMLEEGRRRSRASPIQP